MPHEAKLVLVLVLLVWLWSASVCAGTASQSVPRVRRESLNTQKYLSEWQAPFESASLIRKVAGLARSNRSPAANTTEVSPASGQTATTSLNSGGPRRGRTLRVRVTAIHVERAEFPLGRLLFELTLELALRDANKYLEQQLQLRAGAGIDKVELALSLRSATTCSRQFAGALAAEEYYTRRARLFIVSGCDDAIRGVSRLAGQWRVPIMTAAGFGADLSDKSVHRTLVRVAFSLRAATEFLYKIMRMFQWRRVNLIVDESDANSVALRDSVEKNLAGYQSSAGNFSLVLNTIAFDLESLLAVPADNSSSGAGQPRWHQQSDDKWPNEITEQAVGDTLWRCARFSRVSILLVSQRHLRKFMLSAYDRNMANGQYTFVNMPVLQLDERTEKEVAGEWVGANNSLPAWPGAASARGAAGGEQQRALASHAAGGGSAAPPPPAATGESEFLWRSPLPRARNAQAKQAFESLMSIYLRIPTTKAYVYFANNLNKLANDDAATVAPLTGPRGSNLSSPVSVGGRRRIKLLINPYSASFYDCLLIYARALRESLQLALNESMSSLEPAPIGRRLRRAHAQVSDIMRSRRFDNMLTGSVAINRNGDRETDFTLDDLNAMTGKFAPVILYDGSTRETQRIGRIHWSSDSSVGPTGDNVDCQLTGDCGSTRQLLAKMALWLALLAGPVAILTGLFCFVHRHLRLESQLLDHWWRIHLSEVEIIRTMRKNANDGSLVRAESGSMVSGSAAASFQKRAMERKGAAAAANKLVEGGSGVGADKTEVTRATDTTGVWAESAVDVCYGNITLGIFRLAKVALKPINKFHQSRKLMVELRGLKEMNHSNLCRFVGIVVDEGSLAVVSEFCPKGSLREFFNNESMVIDWTFKYSIINDIISGLMFLHASPLGFHGRLKSSNCLVSGRFVIKLSDYGPHTLLEQQEHQDDPGDGWLRKRVLLAPEHMAAGSVRACGSMLGDVYSFGLLLYEVITNCLPFTEPDTGEFALPLERLFEGLRNEGPGAQLGPDMGLVERVLEGAAASAVGSQREAGAKSLARASAGGPDDRPASVASAPPASVRPLVELMQSCLRFEPAKRPSLSQVHAALKKLTRGVTSGKLLENLTKRMEQYTNNLESLVEAKLAALVEEKLKTEELLYQFVPKSIASRLREGQFVEPEAFECVTVFYSDMVGFTSLSSESSPMEVVDLLSELYLCFDETLEQYDIFKVDTIGDAYIVASGLPQPNDGKHVIEIAHTALELRDRLRCFKIPHMPGRSLEMRVGIHSGPCVAGIVGGLNMPKYCVFGDTLTIGKFMESSGLPMKIHITEESRRLLVDVPEFHIEPRQPKITRDGLPYQTYWLERGAGAK